MQGSPGTSRQVRPALSCVPPSAGPSTRTPISGLLWGPQLTRSPRVHSQMKASGVRAGGGLAFYAICLSSPPVPTWDTGALAMLAVASAVATLTVLSLAGPPWGSRPRRCALTNRPPLRWPSPTVPGLRLGLSQGQPEKELFCRQGELFAISRPSLALSLKEGWGLCHQTCRRGCFHPGSSKLERPPAQPSRSCPHGHAPASRASGWIPSHVA